MPPPETTVPALRAAVPLLCTETTTPFRTFVRGSGVIADSAGTLITAAHVILQAHFNCTLSVMIPDDDWIHVRLPRRFLIHGCHLSEVLDMAVCRTQPAENSHDLGFLRAALLRFGPVTRGERVAIAGFTGWALAPLTRAGHISGQQEYRPPDGCRCNFATDIVVVEGMSGSPVVSDSGEVLGIITQAGKGRFRGTSFGVSFEEAKSLLQAEGFGLWSK